MKKGKQRSSRDEFDGILARWSSKQNALVSSVASAFKYFTMSDDARQVKVLRAIVGVDFVDWIP